MPYIFSRQNPIFRYLAPFVVFMLLTSLQSSLESPRSLFWFYAAKTLITAGVLLWFFWDYCKEIEGKFDFLAVVVGLLVLGVWLLTDSLVPGERNISFNPETLSGKYEYYTLVFFRILPQSAKA